MKTFAFLSVFILLLYGQSKLLYKNCVDVEDERILRDLVAYNKTESAVVFSRQHLECQICFGTAFGLDFRLMEGCGHAYCANCVRSYCEAAIRNQGMMQIILAYDLKNKN